MRNTLPALSIPLPAPSRPIQPASATVDAPQPIPTICLVNATPSALGSSSDASTSTVHNAFDLPPTSSPLAPRPLTTSNASRKRLVPKKSKLGLLGAVKANKERSQNDFSDVVRRIGGTPSAGRDGYEIYVDHTEDPDLEGIVLVKRKKSRLGLDAVAWGPGEGDTSNALKPKPSANALKPKASENVLKPKSSTNILKSKDKENSVRAKPVEHLLKPKVDENQKWWSIGRGRKDSKEQKETHRSKSPELEKKSLRARFGSLDSGIMLSSPTSASHPHPPYSFGANPSQTLLAPPLHIEPEPRPASPATGRGSTPAPGLLALPMEREVSGSGSIALRAMKSMRSMARLTSWSQPKADEKETKKEKPSQKKEEGVEKKKSKKSKKEKEVAEKKAAKEKAAKDGTTKMSTSSFEAGSISDARVPRMSLEVPPKDNVPRTIGKKQSVLGLGLPSSLRFGTVRSAASTATSSTTDPKEERPPTGTVRRTSVSSTMSLNPLASRRPSSAISNSSSLRPPSTASAMSRSSSSSASVKWDEEGLETVKEMRKKDREERRRNSTDSNTVLNGTTKKGSRRSAEGRKRPLVSDLFAEVDINTRPTSPEVQSQRSSVISKEGPVVNIETATNDGHGHAGDPGTPETPVKRARPRPMSEQMLSNVPRPQGIYDNVERAMSISVLDAATDDLASLINRLDLEATPCTPDVSPFASAQRSLANRESTVTLESPLTRAKRFRTTTGSPLRMGLLNRASTTSSVASLRPYAERKGTPKSDGPKTETKKPQSGNEHLVGHHIFPWEDLNWNVSPVKKVKAPPPSVRPTHKRTLSPPMPFDPPPVFQPLHPPKNRVASNPKSTKNSPETKTTELRPSTPLDGQQPPQVPTSTFGRRPNKILRNASGSLDGPVPVFIRNHSRNKSSMDSNRLFAIPIASETKIELGLRGTMGSASLPDVDPEDPDSDIPQELQSILTSNEEHTDAFSISESVQPAPLETPLPPALADIVILPAEPIPVFRAQVFHADSTSGESDVTSDEDTKKSFDFTGEIRMLNESGASERRSFVEQLENAFRTPARIDLRYSFPDSTTDVPPLPALPTDIQDSSTSTTGLSTTVDDFQTDETGESHDTIPSDDEEYCRRLNLPMDSPSIDIVRERPGNPLASSRNSRPSDGQLNRSFRFGGSPMPSQRSDNSCSEEVGEAPLTLSDIIPPPSHHSRNSSRSSLVEEDSSVLKSIMGQANTTLPVASEAAIPRVRPRIESNNSVKDLVDKFSRNSAASQASNQGQSRISFAGLDSFDEVRRGFEFGPNRPGFYPPVSFSRDHNKHDSVFSIASVSSYGSVIDNGAPDPFGYSGHSRPPSEDVSISMSMSVDDTFSFMYQKRRSRVDSDASSFYFRSQPSVVGQIRRGHRAHDSVISTVGAPPVSLYNRSNHGHSHRRGDSSGSVSSVALSYALHGANGGRATWAKHSRNDPSLDSMISDYSAVRISRPGLGDKMLDSEFGHGAPLSAISASPNQSFDSELYDQYQDRTDFDSIMDTRRTINRDSLMDDSEKVSGTDSVFFENSRVSSEGYSVQSHFRPVSIISVDSSHHAPREDDTMISMLGGGRVRRVSMGSLMQQSPCARVEKKGGRRKRPAMSKKAIVPKPEPVEPVEEEEISPVKSIIISKPSIASVTSTKFGGERMIKARKGLLERQSLEESCLIADGEELASFAQELSFTRPRPGTTGRSRSSTCTTSSSSSGSETPPLSSDASSFGGSQSSIDVGQLNYMLSNVTHPMTRPTHGRSHTRGQAHGHRRRPSDVRHSMTSVYETIHEEGGLVGTSDPGEAHEVEIPVAVYNSVHSVHIADDSDGTDIEWDTERGIVAMRKYGALKDEADDTVTESKRVWLDTPFSLFAVQSFQPPHHPSGMKAMLEHSQQNYGPLPLELLCRRVRSRTYSRPSPYPQRTVKPTSPERLSPQPSPQKRETAAYTSVVTIVQPLQPKSVNINSKTPAPAIKDLNPISPFMVEFEKSKGDKSFNERTIRPRVTSSTRRAALGWSKRNTGKSSELKENTSIGTLTTPSESLRLSRPRPRGRPTPGTGARTRGAENVPPVPPVPLLRF